MSEYSSQTVNNPSRLKRYSHQSRFQRAAALLAPSVGEHLLDYGAGDGELICMLHRLSPETRYSLYEPVPEMRAAAQERLKNADIQAPVLATLNEMSALPPQDKIACLEVLEHLPKQELQSALKTMKQSLKPTGRLLVSVPIEIGLTAILKNAVRWLTGQTHEGTTVRNVLLAAAGRTEHIPRESREGFIHSHLGFSHKALEASLVEQGLVIENRFFSPFTYLGAFVNSQIFYLLKAA